MVFDEELTEDDLAVLLADMHVTGKIRWDAYEQAKHVCDALQRPRQDLRLARHPPAPEQVEDHPAAEGL